MKDLLHKLERRRAEITNAASQLPDILTQAPISCLSESISLNVCVVQRLSENTEMQESNKILFSDLQASFEQAKGVRASNQ